MKEDIQSISKLVESLLSRYSSLRDCDRSLWLSVMNVRYGLKDILGERYGAFKALLLQEGVVPFESVSRCRRRVQELNSNLRGKKYDLRQREAKEMEEWLRD